MKYGLKTLNTANKNFSKAAVSVNIARSVNTAYPKPTVNSARPTSNVFNRAHSHSKRPFNKITAVNSSNFNQGVNTVKNKVNTIRPIAVVNTSRPKIVFSAVKGKKGNVVKASACWGNPQQYLKDKGVIDSGCSRHMTGNKSYLLDYEEIDGEFVAFGGNPKGGKITGKGKIRTGKLDFKDMYFVKELKFNLFSVSQMCDKKNSVLFTDTECVVLSSNFKLTDENHVLLKVPRKDNMRLGHINFKTMNKLVRGNLVRRLPSKIFENDHTCVACQKGKEHKASCKFDGKADEGFFVGYSVNIIAENQSNGNAGIKESINAGQAERMTVPSHDYILLPLWTKHPSFSSSTKESPDAGFNPSGEEELKDIDDPGNESEVLKKHSEVSSTEMPRIYQENEYEVNSTNNITTVSSTVNTANIEDNAGNYNRASPFDVEDYPNMPYLEDNYDAENVGAEADMNNLETHISVSPILTTRIHRDHPLTQIIRDIMTPPQTRRMTRNVTQHGMFSSVQQRINHKDFQNCLFACFLSQEEPKKVWTLVDLPHGKRAIGTKWVYMNKLDERGIVIRNKSRLVAQGHTQEEGIDYDGVFAPVARIEAIRLFLAYASYKDFVVYQMDVKSVFLYGKIEEEVYVCRPPGFEDPEFPDKVYMVEKALYGLHQAPKAWYETLSTYLLDNGFQIRTIDKTLFIKKVKSDILIVQVYVDDIIFGSTKKSLCTEFEKLMHKKFQMSSMGKLTFFLGLQVKQKEDGIFISQDKYVNEILKKSGFLTVRIASTPMETSKSLLKDTEAEDVDVHLYRSMIGSLMYLTASRPDIIYLKGQPKLGLWYPKDSPFDLEAYSNSDYAGVSLDRKSTTGGCQFLGSRLISWQCKKQTVVANSTTEVEYVAVANCCGQMRLSLRSGKTEWKRAATTASSLEAEQDSGSGLRCQDTILGGKDAQTRFENVSKRSNDPPLLRVNTLGTGEDSMKLMELMKFV
ncbi:putative ribonuclease H-like domain-containing protein [Tanacetum coccineum]